MTKKTNEVVKLLKNQATILEIHTQILEEQEFLIGLILKKLEKKKKGKRKFKWLNKA